MTGCLAILILVSATDPDFIQNAIEKVQIKGGYNQEHAQWHHAAVYLGDYAICEAVRGGVKADKIYKYIGGHNIRVRRDTSLDHNQGWKIAIQALLRKDFSYSITSIAKIYWQSINGFWNADFKPRNTSQRAVSVPNFMPMPMATHQEKRLREKLACR